MKKNDDTTTKYQRKVPKSKAKLNHKIFMDPEGLTDFVNQNLIEPLSININDRHYIIFYYEKK